MATERTAEQKMYDKATAEWKKGKRVSDLVEELKVDRGKLGREILKRVGGREGWNKLRETTNAGGKAAEKKAPAKGKATKKGTKATKAAPAAGVAAVANVPSKRAQKRAEKAERDAAKAAAKIAEQAQEMADAVDTEQGVDAE